jgi:uncharacterized protein (TIGR03790 family)
VPRLKELGYYLDVGRREVTIPGASLDKGMNAVLSARSLGAMLAAIAWAGFLGAPAAAQGPDNILLVINKTSKISIAVGNYYREKRGVPASQVCTLKSDDREEITRDVFEHDLQRPILNCLERGKLQDKILYIVLTKGVPLKVKDSVEGANDHASVDSELTFAYQDLARVPHALRGSIPNPYFNANERGRFLRFDHKHFPIYLVTRLDGYDLADIRALIDRSLAPAADGRFVLDESWNDNSPGNVWLREAAAELKRAGIPESFIKLEPTNAFLTGETNLMGYASWGSNDHSNHSRFLGNRWVNGGLATEFVSTDARTFERPPEQWTIGQWSDPPGTFFDGSPQSLIADFIHEGVTGVSGNVYEPFLTACARPQILFPAYVQGLNLAESFYLALPVLSWQSVVIGDPLVSPYPGTPLPHEETAPSKDNATGLPVFFSQFVARAKKH